MVSHPTTTTCTSTKLLMGIILFQWMCISYLLLYQLTYDVFMIGKSDVVGIGKAHSTGHGPSTVVVRSSSSSSLSSPSLSSQEKEMFLLPDDTFKKHNLLTATNDYSTGTGPRFKGVAATLMLNNPKWFQRRYTMMIQNVLFNIPVDWGIQIFYTGKGQSQFGLDISPGLTRLIETYPNRIILTRIPSDLLESNPKPKQLWTTEWIWENMHLTISNNNDDDNNNNNDYDDGNNFLNVLTFTGNGAICSNSRTTFHDMVNLKLDYIGMPSTRYKNGVGGDGSTHSMRNRNSMLDAIQYAKKGAAAAIAGNNKNNNNNKGYHDGNERDDIFFLRILMEMNEKNDNANKINNEHRGEEGTPKKKYYRIATKEQTELFGGINWRILKMTAGEWSNDTMKKEAEGAGPPLIVSGTLPKLGNAARELMMDLCPELKVIFPSLHNPFCFGAHPKGEKCAESICALKKDRTGGC